MDIIRNKKGFICDMDGVIYHGNKILDGVADFVKRRGFFAQSGGGQAFREHIL